MARQAAGRFAIAAAAGMRPARLRSHGSSSLRKASRSLRASRKIFARRRTSCAVFAVSAALDEAESFPPEREIWTGEKLDWEVVNPALPQYPRSSKG